MVKTGKEEPNEPVIWFSCFQLLFKPFYWSRWRQPLAGLDQGFQIKWYQNPNIRESNFMKKQLKTGISWNSLFNISMRVCLSKFLELFGLRKGTSFISTTTVIKRKKNLQIQSKENYNSTLFHLLHLAKWTNQQKPNT